MACSEVQRTLVKSPPELWAEISDPTALARHLDAFGEIRITRVEPEQRVEWQAGDTVGSVVIKPSGWGTKVSLTVTSEHEPATEPAAHTRPAAVAKPEPEPEPDPVAESAAAIVEPDAAAATDPIAAPDRSAGPLSAAPQPELAAAPAPQAEPEPEHDAVPEPDPVAAAEPEAAAHTQPSAVAKPEPKIATPPQPQAEHDPIMAVAERDDEAEPATRRGSFFARLFARRRANHAGERSPAADAQAPSASRARAHETRDAAEPYNALAMWASQIEADDDLPAERADRLETSGGEHAAASEQIADAAQVAVHEDAGTSEPAGQATGELEAIEQAAAEQVTAVLTGVLDRLGAAHHRPFSRS